MKIDKSIKRPDFALFQKVIFPKVMKWEGGDKLHNVKGDRGGWTKWGIAYNFWKHIFDDFEDFKDTTLEEATYFAYDRFYAVIRADLVPVSVRLKYFDMAYNMGTNRAIRMMQTCIGVQADGKIGPVTMARMRNLKEDCLKEKRDAFYRSIAGRSQRLRRFLQGWLNRSNSIYNFNYD